MSYDVLSLVTEKDGQFVAEPGIFFPATVARIKECVVKADPLEVMTPGWPGRPDREPVADGFLKLAEKYAPETLDLALLPFDESLPEKTKVLRAEALGFVESWFKRALVLKVGKGVRLYITKDLNYRR